MPLVVKAQAPKADDSSSPNLCSLAIPRWGDSSVFLGNCRLKGTMHANSDLKYRGGHQWACSCARGERQARSETPRSFRNSPRCSHRHSQRQTCGASQYLTVHQCEGVLCACQTLGKYKLSPVIQTAGSGEDADGKVRPCASHSRSPPSPRRRVPPLPGPPLGLLAEPSFPNWERLEYCPQRALSFPRAWSEMLLLGSSWYSLLCMLLLLLVQARGERLSVLVQSLGTVGLPSV